MLKVTYHLWSVNRFRPKSGTLDGVIKPPVITNPWGAFLSKLLRKELVSWNVSALAQTINSFIYLILDVHPSLKSNCNIEQVMGTSIGCIPVKKDSLNNRLLMRRSRRILHRLWRTIRKPQSLRRGQNGKKIIWLSARGKHRNKKRASWDKTT